MEKGGGEVNIITHRSVNEIWNYSLTGIRNVEEECHRHHCEPKIKIAVSETSGLFGYEQASGRTISKTERNQKQRERRHPQTRVECGKGG
jgi:hypothetical protein